MVAPYSEDFKLRFNNEEKTQRCSRIFQNICQHNWIQEFKKDGKFIEKPKHQKGHSHKVKDLETFKKFIDENAHTKK